VRGVFAPPGRYSVRTMELVRLCQSAHERRAALVERLRREGTDAWRLMHGAAEGRPGFTLDRYGPLLLAQTFREALTDDELAALVAWAAERHPETQLAWNHRGPAAHAGRVIEGEQVCSERGVRFAVRARHRGQDPWLFLDLRGARARLAGLAEGKRVLNLFAYTCGAGIAAAVAGAREVWNVDFAASALEVGRRNAELNGLDPERLRFVHEDALPVLWQLAGGEVKGRASVRPYQRFGRESFELVFLDPPAWSKGPFGAIDVVRDYAALVKPCLRLLAPGGVLIATHHAPAVELATWRGELERCAQKIGRPWSALETFGPEEDFPAFDGRAPLKIALCTAGGTGGGPA